MMATTGKLTLTPKERHMVGDYILKHCTIPEGCEWAKWDEESGGTDVSATEKLRPLIPKISVYHIRYLRQSFGLPHEPVKLRYIGQKKTEEKLTGLEELRDKIEALLAHVKSCDLRLKDHETRFKDYDVRLRALEDRYISPKR